MIEVEKILSLHKLVILNDDNSITQHDYVYSYIQTVDGLKLTIYDVKENNDLAVSYITVKGKIKFKFLQRKVFLSSDESVECEDFEIKDYSNLLKKTNLTNIPSSKANKSRRWG